MSDLPAGGEEESGMTRVSEVKPASIPTFAVVGRPNKGKSSIVATLARDDAVYILSLIHI